MSESLINFYPYQRLWLDDDSRFKIGMFARQTGKTFSTCGEIVRDCIQAEMEGRRVRWVILSRGERQAKEAVDEAIKPICRAFYLIYKGLKDKAGPRYEEGEFRDADSEATYKTQEVVFPGGSRITALPANPDTARGYSANVFLDEFAFHQDSRAIWKALFPVISKPGLKLRITSTPNGKNNKFYELWTAQDDAWSRHSVDIYDAVQDGLPRDIEELRAGIKDQDAWEQEYELAFLDAALAWLTFDLITGCEHSDAGNPDLYQGGHVVIGNDIAIRGDLWVAWVWEVVGDVLWTREVSILRRGTFAEQDTELDRLMDRYTVLRLVMDQTGMGEKPVEDAKRRYGELRVEGVLFNPSSKLSIATHAKQAFEDKRVRIPAGDVALRADLHKTRKVIGPTGAPRLLAESDSEGHADRAWACWLGIAGAANDTPPPAGANIPTTRHNPESPLARIGKIAGGLIRKPKAMGLGPRRR